MDGEPNDSLAPGPIDEIVAALRITLSAVPVAGSLLAELIGVVVPNQRLDRLARFARHLERRVANLERDDLKSRLSDPSFAELLEEGAMQATRATSDERLEYLASIISHGLTDEQISYAESRHLLRILGEINDIEMVWLQSFHRIRTMGPNEFYDRHENVLRPISRAMGQSQEVYDRLALRDSYTEHLEQLGLVSPRYNVDRQTGMPEFDKSTGRPKVRSHDLTALGSLMLRQLDLARGEEGQ